MPAADNNRLIRHTGRVVEVFPSGVDVSVLSSSVCSGCAVKKACGMTESEEKIITVITPYARYYSVGDQVTVTMKQSMGVRAVMYVYIFPLIVIFAALAGMIQLGMLEIISGSVALGLLGIYYLILYFLREKIGREISFDLEKPDNNQP